MQNKELYLERLKKIKSELNMDWIELKEENTKDPSKCAYAIFVDNVYYRKYIGEVGPLYETNGYAIKIKKAEFLNLFKGNNKLEKIRNIINTYIDDDHFDNNKLSITDADIDLDENKICISYGDTEEPESSSGYILIKETTVNYLKNYNYTDEQIGR